LAATPKILLHRAMGTKDLNNELWLREESNYCRPPVFIMMEKPPPKVLALAIGTATS